MPRRFQRRRIAEVTRLTGLSGDLGNTTPEFWISGINEGAKLSDIALNSGTVGAAVIVILRDIPAIAISAEGDTADDLAALQLFAALVGEPAQRRTACAAIPLAVTGLNVNVPTDWDATDIAFT